jgi:hypothetical protein
MGRFDITPEVAEEWREEYRSSVEPHADGEVLAVGAFRPTGGGTKMAISKARVGALAYGAAHPVGQEQGGWSAKEESAVWDRADLIVGTDDRQTTTRLTLELADGQTVVCDQEGLGDNPWADGVIRELQA